MLLQNENRVESFQLTSLENTLTIKLKEKVKSLFLELTEAKSTIEEMKRKTKYGKILDLEMEIQVYEGEMIRLSNLL